LKLSSVPLSGLEEEEAVMDAEGDDVDVEEDELSSMCSRG
jgi:hypothetical protein